jgi:hypothetical protein
VSFWTDWVIPCQWAKLSDPLSAAFLDPLFLTRGHDL